mmetsp:Transcript_7929/g.27721  ORF Transcript_7929/g.27721 Transcript_7929/m.27721 type:complete len:453 (+) Transcript_7929:530-1888(+)
MDRRVEPTVEEYDVVRLDDVEADAGAVHRREERAATRLRLEALQRLCARRSRHVAVVARAADFLVLGLVRQHRLEEVQRALEARVDDHLLAAAPSVEDQAQRFRELGRQRKAAKLHVAADEPRGLATAVRAHLQPQLLVDAPRAPRRRAHGQGALLLQRAHAVHAVPHAAKRRREVDELFAFVPYHRARRPFLVVIVVRRRAVVVVVFGARRQAGAPRRSLLVDSDAAGDCADDPGRRFGSVLLAVDANPVLVLLAQESPGVGAAATREDWVQQRGSAELEVCHKDDKLLLYTRFVERSRIALEMHHALDVLAERGLRLAVEDEVDLELARLRVVVALDVVVARHDGSHDFDRNRRHALWRQHASQHVRLLPGQVARLEITAHLCSDLRVRAHLAAFCLSGSLPKRRGGGEVPRVAVRHERRDVRGSVDKRRPRHVDEKPRRGAHERHEHAP